MCDLAGAAGCAIAALIKSAADLGLQGRSVVVVCCGGNISLPTLRRILAEDAEGMIY